MVSAVSVWTPRKGGGAHLIVGGVAVVEIEPMGTGWWVSAGEAGCEMVSGSLGEAKVRALEMLSGDRLAGEVSDGDQSA